MTEEQAKEQLSRNFVKILASNRRYKSDTPELDNGVDLKIYSTYSYTKPEGGIRMLDSGNSIELQLKSTIERHVIRDGTILKYDLEAKSYNDLVTRKNGKSLTPLILVLFILPNDNIDWVEVKEDELLLRKHAYWYQPAAGLHLTNNVSSKRIEIPLVNKIDCEFCPTIFNNFGLD